MSEHNFKVGDRVEYDMARLRKFGITAQAPTGLVILRLETPYACVVVDDGGATYRVLFCNLIHKEPA